MLKKNKKRTPIATETWAHVREPKDKEPEKHRKNHIFYCKYCLDPLYSTLTSNSFQAHLNNKYRIKVKLTLGPI